MKAFVFFYLNSMSIFLNNLSGAKQMLAVENWEFHTDDVIGDRLRTFVLKPSISENLVPMLKSVLFTNQAYLKFSFDAKITASFINRSMFSQRRSAQP